ncbi:MAG: ABC transporter permease [Pseudonocardia sp.]|nr:ABC transporter permease [Pseudonocardia sp.]
MSTDAAQNNESQNSAPDGGDAAAVPAPAAGLLRRTWRRRQVKIGTALTLVVVVVALLGPVLGPLMTGYDVGDFVGKPFHADGVTGTDNLGRDVLTRFLAGGGPVLLYALAATAIGLIGGGLAGMIAGYSGGRLDSLVMRGGDVLLSFPQLVLALLAVAVLGSSGWLLVLVIGITHIPRVARVARQATLSVAGQDYVLAARMYGVPRRRILSTEILPNITGPLMVELGLRLTYSIGYIASLSFLGLGVQPPAADWGLQINENRIALVVAPWGVLLPVAAIAILTVGTNMITDGLARASADTSVEATP